MSNYNKVILIGRLTRDPELKNVGEKGTQIANFCLAVDRKFSKANEVDFINCIAFNKLAEISGKFLKRGKLTLIEGSLRVDSYISQNDERKTSFKVNVDAIQILEKKETSQTSDQSNQLQKNLDPDFEDVPF